MTLNGYLYDTSSVQERLMRNVGPLKKESEARARNELERFQQGFGDQR